MTRTKSILNMMMMSLQRHGRRRTHLRPLRVLDVVRQREHRRHHREPLPALRPERHHRRGRQPLRLRGLRQHPGARVRRLPADLRGHHRRPDQRRHRRPRQVLDLAGLQRPVGDLLLLPDRPHGLGRWPAVRQRDQPVVPDLRVHRRHRQRRPDRLRRWHRGPHQRRYGRPGARARRRQADRLRQDLDAPAQRAAHHDRRRPAVVRLVRLQRGLRARARRHLGAWCGSTPRPPPARPCSAGSSWRRSATATPPRSVRPPASSPAWSPSPRPVARSARSARSSSASSPVGSRRWPSA